MKKIPTETILSTAKAILDENIETNRKRITFPVTIKGQPYYSPDGENKEIQGEMWTMYTVDGKQWLIKIEEQVYNLGIYPKVYTGD
ncbi:hypothetical protein [Sphingobacterium endophyticum]|uniref:hypothetical protein n=1 Tax=Sphingobacterium endophyticum TaxID=2546448 RepID=UPI0012E2F524|nr:hypothetical protein [Sphingobacterium endophyticum]